MSELKPCPFCGGEMKTDVVTFDVEFYEPPYESWYLEHVDLDSAADERCPIPTTDTFYDTEAEAIEAWNTRAERTCELTLDGTDGCFGCSECFENIPPLANYCPNCGRKVVR